MIVKICWVLLALNHALPAFALFNPALLAKLYGVAPGSDTFTLMHHRASLFLAIFVTAIWAVFRPEVRPLATAAVGTSMVSFVLIWMRAGAPRSLRPIAIADSACLPFLLYAGWQAFGTAG